MGVMPLRPAKINRSTDPTANRALAVAMEMDYGSVHVNGATVQNEAQAPYGGTKKSGYGRFDGRAVVDEFTELKWVTIEPHQQQYPF